MEVFQLALADEMNAKTADIAEGRQSYNCSSCAGHSLILVVLFAMTKKLLVALATVPCRAAAGDAV